MYMSKLTIDPKDMIRQGVYEGHQALCKVFLDSPDQKRDFVYRSLGERDFLVVSARPPRKSSLLSACRTKEYRPRLKIGERLFFSLRFNPVLKRRDQDGRQVRVDMVQDERKRLMAQGMAKEKLPRRTILAEQAGADWIEARREELGFELEKGSAMIESYGQERFTKSGGGKKIILAKLDLRGFCRVTDPEILTRKLYKGVGPAKGFGFGLLLVRRAG